MTTYNSINVNLMQPDQHLHVPAISGLDSMSPKSAVQPGSLFECMNYEVALEAGYRQLDGLLEYTGNAWEIPTRFWKATGNESIFSFNDVVPGTVYAIGEEDAGTYVKYGTARLLAAENPGDGSSAPVYFTLESGDLDKFNDLLLGPGATASHAIGTSTISASEVDFDSVSYDEELLYLSSVTGDASNVHIADSGTKLFVVGDGDPAEVFRFELGTAYDISSATYSNNMIAVTATTGDNCTDVHLNSNGTRMYICSSSSSRIYQYDLSTPFDLTSASYASKSLNYVTETNGNSRFYINADEDKLYLVTEETAAQAVYQYDFATAGDIATASYANKSYNLPATPGSQLENPYGIYLSTSGTQMFICDGEEDSIYEFSLSTAWDISTATLVGNVLDFGTEQGINVPRGLDISEDGEKVYIIDTIDSGGTVAQYSISVTVGGIEILDQPIPLDKFTLQEIGSVHTDYITDYETVAGQLSNSGTTVPGTGRINGLFIFNEQVYAARDLADGSGSALYTIASQDEQLTQPSWTEVDLGYEVPFDAGELEPITFYDKKFIEETTDLVDPVENKLGGKAESVDTIDTGWNGSWEADSINNVLSDSGGDGSGALCSVSGANDSPSPATLDNKTARLHVTGFGIKDAVTTESPNVVGIEVSVRFAFSPSGSQVIDDSEIATIDHISLLGLGDSDNKGSDVPTYDFNDSGTFRTVTLGGPTDTWNTTELSTKKVFSEEFGVALQFVGGIVKTNGTSGITAKMNYTVPWIKVSVYFENGQEKVFFWDGASDVATADVVNYSLTDGSFDLDNAEGYLSMYNVTNPSSIEDNLEIRTAANGAGSFIGTTTGPASKNVLPSSSEMEANNSMMVGKEINFFIDADKNAFYGATGAGRAFHFNGTHFWFLHAPVPDDKDKPRYLEEHQNHLMLAYDAGSVIVSPPGKPNILNGLDGATEWGFGERITGLMKVNGSATAVFMESGIDTFVGNSISSFTTQTMSKSTGALDYTVVNMGQPIYTDFSGISNLSASQQFGNFAWGRLSQRISKDLQNKIQSKFNPAVLSSSPVVAIPVSRKNQYRLYFADGEIYTMTMFGAAGDQPMFTVQNYSVGNSSNANRFVPTAVARAVLNSGKELIMIGTEEGKVFSVDACNPVIVTSTELLDYDTSITFNPFFGGEPFRNIKFSEVMIHFSNTGYQQFDASAGVNFLRPIAEEDVDTVAAGTIDDNMDWNIPFNRVSTYLANITDGFSLKLESTTNSLPAHIVQALTYKGVALGDQNRSSKTY